MQWFESKKAILEYCWKDGKDIRWLERAMKDGKVRFCDDAYYLTSEYVEDLEKENGELEEENANLRKRIKELEWGKWEKSDLKDISKAMGERVLEHGEINNLKMDNEELRGHLKYAWGRIDAIMECVESIKKTYKEKLWWDDEKFYTKVWFKVDEHEWEERLWASEHSIIDSK